MRDTTLRGVAQRVRPEFGFAVLATSLLGVLLAGCGSKKSEASAAPIPTECLPYYDAGREPLADAPIHTPRWAFEPWLSKDYSSSEDTLGYIKQSLALGIPVGVAVLDSPWESNYNSFTPDENPGRYTDFDSLITTLNSLNVKVVVWITQFENTVSFDLENDAGTTYPAENPLYDFGVKCGFFINDARSWSWYKGFGAALDFFNPAAVNWWHSLQDPLLARGISGYKVDFGDEYVGADPVTTAKGSVARQAYSEAYYRDLRAYATSKLGTDFITDVRGWDVSYAFTPRTYARPEDAPVVWSGDDTRDWFGLSNSLNKTFMSATLGYTVLGSDIGGYLQRSDTDLGGPIIPFDTLVFDRWVAVGGLSPFMQLHTQADVMPWTVPDNVQATISLYQYWATLHHELVPFFYSLAEETYAGHVNGIVRPVGTSGTWAGDYRYMLGEALLVAPILDDAGIRDVSLPPGPTYYDWWSPMSDGIDGGTTLLAYDSTDRAKVPLFAASGAIIPLSVSTNVVPVGDSTSAGAWTILVYPDETASSFVLYEDDDTTTTVSQVLNAGTTTVHADRARKPLLVRVRSDVAATSVEVNSAAAPSVTSFDSLTSAASPSWFAEPSTRSTWVYVPPATAPVEIDIVTSE